MFLHHRDEHISRQGKEFFIESAHDCGGHFDEVGDFVEQAFFDDGFSADEGCGLVDLFDDGGFAFFFIEQDACFADHIKIFISRWDGDVGRAVGA